jgi:glycosyltransferase involved in cell wall biosynthesis
MAAIISLLGFGPCPADLVTGERVRWLRAPDLPGRLGKRPGGRLWLNTVFTAVSALHAPDVLFFPWSVLPRLLAAPAVVTVHDVCFRTVPEQFADGGRTGDAQLRAAVRRADAILAPSAASKRGIIAAYSAPPERVTVVHHGIDPMFHSTSDRDDVAARLSVGLAPPYFLCVSTHEERKNLQTLVEAYVRLFEGWGEAGEPPALVFIGQITPYTSVLRRQLADSPGAARHTYFLQGVSDCVLAALYRGSTAVLLPSLCEGFGFPLVEAVACGRPALVSDLEVFRELAGSMATYIPTHDVAAWTVHLRRAALAAPSPILARGVSQISTLSWATSARQTLEVIEQVARRSKHGGS